MGFIESRDVRSLRKPEDNLRSLRAEAKITYGGGEQSGQKHEDVWRKREEKIDREQRKGRITFNDAKQRRDTSDKEYSDQLTGSDHVKKVETLRKEYENNKERARRLSIQSTGGDYGYPL